MDARAPRHLAEPPKRFGLSPLQRVFLAALLGLAAITAVIALLTRDAGNGGRRAAAPATTRAQAATTATTAPAATTTAPATRPVRPTPGNLLADGDFERDLAGWAPLGGAQVERVEGGESGRWAAAVGPGTGAGRPGMVRRDAATTEAGTTYEAIFWVQAPEGGQVVLALRELAGGREISADQAGYDLPGGSWQQIAVEHHTAAPGSSLALEVLGYDLAGEGRLLVDGVDLQTE
ncbi:MAG TPA: carbohydrate binding domain-containing protein [Actinomycetota bacterium]|nr:carbohydrate binding domain-containing protein [Actinomycetota bacterium]